MSLRSELRSAHEPLRGDLRTSGPSTTLKIFPSRPLCISESIVFPNRLQERTFPSVLQPAGGKVVAGLALRQSAMETGLQLSLCILALSVVILVAAGGGIGGGTVFVPLIMLTLGTI